MPRRVFKEKINSKLIKEFKNKITICAAYFYK